MRWLLIEEWLAGRMSSEELDAWLYLEFRGG